MDKLVCYITLFENHFEITYPEFIGFKYWFENLVPIVDRKLLREDSNGLVWIVSLKHLNEVKKMASCYYHRVVEEVSIKVFQSKENGEQLSDEQLNLFE